MNLIEQLGGYEAVKGFYERAVKHGFELIEIRDALLGYRRANNIFEESDKIVFIDDFMHGELMTVAWTRKGEVWMDDGAKRCTDLSMIRHATDEEIATGKRLN